jgi:hypothetical protein
MSDDRNGLAALYGYELGVAEYAERLSAIFTEVVALRSENERLSAGLDEALEAAAVEIERIPTDVHMDNPGLVVRNVAARIVRGYKTGLGNG